MISRRALVLLIGDLVALALFAILGRNTHDEAIGFGAMRAVAGTAAPFLVGWLVASPLLGALRAATTATLPTMLRVVLASWIAAYPLAMLTRGIGLGRTSPLSFYIVAFTVPLLFVVVWRLVFLFVEERRAVRGPTI
jgi:DUF3054 family protein